MKHSQPCISIIIIVVVMVVIIITGGGVNLTFSFGRINRCPFHRQHF